VGIGSSNTLLDSQSGVWRFLGTGSGTGVKSPVHCICVYDGVLTDTEIQSLHDWSQSRFTPRKQWPGGGLSIPSASGQTWEPKFLDSIQASRITLANVTGGQLSNSGANVETGTWALSEDDTGKYYDCVGNGQLTHPLIGADGFTTDAFVEEGTATLTKTTTHLEIDATAGDKIRALRITV